jgi:hypothetical protein
MKGLELLVIGQEYVVTTQFNPEGYDHLVFTGFEQENDDVTLACFEDVQRGYESFFDTSVPTNQVIVSNEESVVNLNLPTPAIADNYKRIKSLAKQYDMVLDLDRIKRQDNEELERIIQMIERTYANR